MRRLLILLIVTVLSFSADLRALASHEDIVAESTDKAHSDADHVRIERDGSDATVVITRNRGIGSARVQIAGNWKSHLHITFRNFSNLEKFAVTDGNTCIDGSLRPAAEYIGTWKNECCERLGTQTRSFDLLKMKVDGSDIRLEIPPQLLRSKQSSILRLAWIDAYRR